MKLGDLLVREGRLSEAGLHQAIEHQRQHGGRLGTCLVELGLIDAETLSVYLGLELSIPIARRAALNRAKRAAVRLITPELAERHLCVPLVVEERALIVAMRDPLDLVALDELYAVTGYRILPRVAPEILLSYYVERYYGVPRPERHRAAGDRVFDRRRASDDLEPPPAPLPGLPPVAREPITPPPTPAPPLRAITPAEDPDDLVRQLEATEGEIAETVEKGRRPRPAVTPPPPPPEAMRSAPSPERTASVEPLALDAALERMAAVTSRGDVADALIGFARTLFDVAVLLVVRDEMAFGWRGFGPDLSLDRIEALLIPLAIPSLFRTAASDASTFKGAAPPTTLHAHLFKVLRTQAPRQAVVLPVLIRDRVVNLLYGHKNGEAKVSSEDLEAMDQAARAASDAYVRLIAQQKQAK